MILNDLNVLHDIFNEGSTPFIYLNNKMSQALVQIGGDCFLIESDQYMRGLLEIKAALEKEIDYEHIKEIRGDLCLN